MAEHLPASVSESFAAIHRAAASAARFVARGDDVWAVYELPATPYDRRRSATLVFECERAMHRVRDYPSGWRTCSDEALMALIRRG